MVIFQFAMSPEGSCSNHYDRNVLKQHFHQATRGDSRDSPLSRIKTRMHKVVLSAAYPFGGQALMAMGRTQDPIIMKPKIWTIGICICLEYGFTHFHPLCQGFDFVSDKTPGISLDPWDYVLISCQVFCHQCVTYKKRRHIYSVRSITTWRQR